MTESGSKHFYFSFVAFQINCMCVCNKYNVQRLFRLVRNRSHEAVQTLGTKQTAKNVTTENEHTKQV